MNYTKKHHNEIGWIVTEDNFQVEHISKCETIMAIGNGYLGVRSALEESYVDERRNTFIAGLFNQFAPNEVTELPNLPDIFQTTIKLNGITFDLTRGEVKSYSRELCLKNGEVYRHVIWEHPFAGEFELIFRRFASMVDEHRVVQRIDIRPITKKADIEILSGINGQVTNSGVAHLTEEDKRLFERSILRYNASTTQSETHISVYLSHQCYKNEELDQPEQLVMMDRRKINMRYRMSAEVSETITIEKVGRYVTSHDLEYQKSEYQKTEFQETNSNKINDDLELGKMKDLRANRYKDLLQENESYWTTNIWEKVPIQIVSDSPVEQLAIRFAQYHLHIMTPRGDVRKNIAAKGLTGEGYKGHIFWDTEVFMLPYFIYNYPEQAKDLLIYRYKGLAGARQKAKDNNYLGAMFPWESAVCEEGEVTPIWGAADIITGEPTKIWSGFIEQHITADIALAVWQYYKVTQDEQFMLDYGYELMIDTGIFWSSRVKWDEDKSAYVILEVIGPDEYKEHVDNNAFTNYMAHFNLQLALKYSQHLQEKYPENYENLSKKLSLMDHLEKMREVEAKLYLPKPDENKVIPQDDTYLKKTIIDISQYKAQAHVGGLFQDYNLEQVNDMQISKQADVMLLMYLMEHAFEEQVKLANWAYYEPKTTHDSSLSLSTHAIMALDLGLADDGYELFQKAAQIDLGPEMLSSKEGIHAASLGGLWQCIVFGFGGVRMLGGRLRIEPKCPKTWQQLSFTFIWRGDQLKITIEKDQFSVENLTRHHEVIEFVAYKRKYLLSQRVVIKTKNL